MLFYKQWVKYEKLLAKSGYCFQDSGMSTDELMDLFHYMYNLGLNNFRK